MDPKSALDKYTWQDKGSSYLPSDLIAAVLHQQLEHSQAITKVRTKIWSDYQESLSELEDMEKIRLAKVPRHCQTNGHIAYLLCSNGLERNRLLEYLAEQGIGAQFHYIPLHSSNGARKFGARTVGQLWNTNKIADCIVRLPSYAGMTSAEFEKVVDAVYAFYGA